MALIMWLDDTLFHLKLEAEECLQLGDTDRLDLLGLQVWLTVQVFPEIGVEDKLEEGECRLWLLMWAGMFWGLCVLKGTMCLPG